MINNATRISVVFMLNEIICMECVILMTNSSVPVIVLPFSSAVHSEKLGRNYYKYICPNSKDVRCSRNRNDDLEPIRHLGSSMGFWSNMINAWWP